MVVNSEALAAGQISV